jgi:hypothetical protein
LEELDSMDIAEVLASLENGKNSSERVEADMASWSGTDRDRESYNPIHEIAICYIFSIDDVPAVSNVDKLQYIFEAVRGSTPGRYGVVGLTILRYKESVELYIAISRGDEFADPSDPFFFAKTFPTLFPFGTGGSRIADELELTTD